VVADGLTGGRRWSRIVGATGVAIHTVGADRVQGLRVLAVRLVDKGPVLLVGQGIRDRRRRTTSAAVRRRVREHERHRHRLTTANAGSRHVRKDIGHGDHPGLRKEVEHLAVVHPQAEALGVLGAEQVQRARELALTGVSQVDVDRRRLDARVAEQELYGAQVGAGLDPVRRIGGPQRCRADRLVDARGRERLLERDRERLAGDRSLAAAAARRQHRALRPDLAVVGAQLPVQPPAQRQLPVLAARAASLSELRRERALRGAGSLPIDRSPPTS
jgi:hypothetical protein